MATLSSPGLDSPMVQGRLSYTHEGNIIGTMDFEAAAQKLFSVLLKGEKSLRCLPLQLQSKDTAAYMDQASEWRRKVDRYKKDLVLPTLHYNGTPETVWLRCFA